MLLFMLAIFAGVIGLFVTAAAVFTIWKVNSMRSRPQEDGEAGPPLSQLAGEHFLSWTVFDYALFLLLGLGLVFLLADLVAVIRDRADFPPYHIGYLLCGFIYVALGILFLFARLTAVLKLQKSSGMSSPQHRKKPDHADRAENGI